MKYRIRPVGEWYRIERLERTGPFKKRWNEVMKVSIFDPRFVVPMVPIIGPKTAAEKEREEKMPTNNAQHALKVLEEIKKADAIVGEAK